MPLATCTRHAFCLTPSPHALHLLHHRCLPAGFFVCKLKKLSNAKKEGKGGEGEDEERIDMMSSEPAGNDAQFGSSGKKRRRGAATATGDGTDDEGGSSGEEQVAEGAAAESAGQRGLKLYPNKHQQAAEAAPRPKKERGILKKARAELEAERAAAAAARAAKLAAGMQAAGSKQQQQQKQQQGGKQQKKAKK